MKYITILLLLLPLLLVACSQDASESSPKGADRPVVYAVNYPVQYFAQRLGGDRVEVHMPAARDEDPAFWKPDDATVAEFQKADVILLNGAGYAAWIAVASLPDEVCVDTSAAFADRYIKVDADVEHKHGPEGKVHGHGSIASTTWLDMLQAIAQAKAVNEALGDKAQGFDTLERELLELDSELQKIGVRGKLLFGSHPVYQYFARRYGANMRNVHFEPGEHPGEKGWAQLVTIKRAHPAKLMLWEGEPAELTKKKLEALGIAWVVFDPCGNVPDEGDFLTAMRANIERLRKALQ